MTSLPDFSDRPAAEQRFAKQLQQLISLMNAAGDSEKTALALYQSNSRQTLFYLEGLSRIYRNIHNHKRFERMRPGFKELEDQLGKVDYYDGFIKEFSVQPGFPLPLLERMKQHYSKELDTLQYLLREKGWVGNEFHPVEMIWEELESASWKKPKKDRRAVAKTMMAQVDFVENSYRDGSLNFHTIENGVHEFRRQLRWISIYAQALNGLIQLRQTDNPDPKLKKYLSKEILENPFNKLPELTKDIEPIYIDAPNFYALSWMIEEGGKLKDDGLRILLIEATIRETQFADEKEVKRLTKELAKQSKRSPRQIKDEMKILASDFIDTDKILKRIRQDLKQAIKK